MPYLKLAINVVEILLACIVLLVLGDYLGYKLGRRRLLTWAGVAALAIIIVFAIYSAVVLI